MRTIGQIKALYIKLYCNRKNLILLAVCLIAICIMAYSSLNLGFMEGEFQFLKEDYTDEYIRSCYNFSLIINSVIIPIMFLVELKEETVSLNSILIPRVKKKRLLLSKIFVMFDISFVLCTIEMIIIGIFPCVFYPCFCLEAKYLFIGLYLFLYTLFSVLFLNVLMKFIKLFIVGGIPVLIYLLSNIIKDSFNSLKYNICLETRGLTMISYNSIYSLIVINVLLICIYIRW